MTAKQALLDLVPELSEDDAQRLLEYARNFWDDEPLSDEEREELFKIQAQMEAGDAVPWPAVKRRLGLPVDPDEASEEDLEAVREGRAAFERGECIAIDAVRKLLSQ